MQACMCRYPTVWTTRSQLHLRIYVCAYMIPAYVFGCVDVCLYICACICIAYLGFILSRIPCLISARPRGWMFSFEGQLKATWFVKPSKKICRAYTEMSQKKYVVPRCVYVYVYVHLYPMAIARRLLIVSMPVHVCLWRTRINTHTQTYMA